MLLNVNTHANSVIESSLMKFMEVLMNVYLPYSFNCRRKLSTILTTLKRDIQCESLFRRSQPVL